MNKRFWFRFLEWFCPPSLYEGIEGDLLEAYELNVAEKGVGTATRRLAWNVIRFFRPGIIFRNKFKMPISTIMVRNYLKVASRNIARRKMYSFINAFGLSIAIAFCTLIFLFVQDEKSFDQFHTNKENIYQILTANYDGTKFDAGDRDPYNRNAWLPAQLADIMQDEFPEVRYVSRFLNFNTGIMRYDDRSFTQSFTCVDTGFFRMFSFRVISGDSRKPLRKVSDAVLTPAVATKFFGDDDPIGKTFTLDSDGTVQSFTVTAIIEAPPANSSLVFDMLVLSDASTWFVRNRNNWGNFSYPTFVQLHPEQILIY